MVSGTISIRAERLQISDVSRKQNDSIWNGYSDWLLSR